MFISFRSKKGQYAMELATLIAFVGAALAALTTYMKNCKQGDLREAGESIGDPFASNGTTTVESSTEYTENITTGGDHTTTRNGSSSQTTSTTGN